jgi:formylglycine-generating enzyme required for sulfatase activity
VYTYAGSNTVGDVAWYSVNALSATHPVGEKIANALDLKDMSGNVWECCWDWYGSVSLGTPTDPVGPGLGAFRVIRGGSWSDHAANCAVFYRNNYDPLGGYGIIGFRVACP